MKFLPVTLERYRACYPRFDGWDACAVSIADIIFPLSVIEADAMALLKGDEDRLWAEIVSVPICVALSEDRQSVTFHPTPDDAFELVAVYLEPVKVKMKARWWQRKRIPA